MPLPRQDDIVLRLIKDVNDIRSALRRVTANLPLFDIANENTPDSIASDQNNYTPGNYDILRLVSLSNISITGISNGKKGRRLQIFNVGSYSISLSHQSSGSLAANRFKFVNDSDFIIPPNGNALIYYDETASRWVGGDMASVYDVSNESTPAQITSNQNNYDIGLTEVLRLSTDAARSITGISGGVKGRSLRIFNVGSFSITLPYESTSSAAANRFYTPSGENTVLYPKSGVWLYYDSVTQRWRIPDAPTWMGTYGKTVIIGSSGVQSIPNDTDTKLTNLDTVISDEWGMWNNTTHTLTIPETGVYLGAIGCQFDETVSGGSYRAVKWVKNGWPSFICPMQLPPCGTPVATDISAPLFYKFTAGDTLEVYVGQDCGVNKDVFVWQMALTRIT